MPNPNPVFILFGSGPGIGLALAKAFATRNAFAKFMLCARNDIRLQDEDKQVEAAATSGTVEVGTFPIDLAAPDALPGKLPELGDRFLGDDGAKGQLSCIWYNAASVRFSEVLATGMGELEGGYEGSVSTLTPSHDTPSFPTLPHLILMPQTNALSLYTTAQWSVPLLLSNPQSTDNTTPIPSLVTTSSHLPEHPMPVLLFLSMAKTAQQNPLFCLHEASGRQIRPGSVKVCGVVGEADQVFNSTEIARRGVEFGAEGKKGEWSASSGRRNLGEVGRVKGVRDEGGVRRAVGGTWVRLGG